MVSHAPMCPACRTTVPPRRGVAPRFCPECGARLPAPIWGGQPALPVHSGLAPETASGALASLLLGVAALFVPLLGMFLGLMAIMIGNGVREQVRYAGGRLRGGGL